MAHPDPGSRLEGNSRGHKTWKIDAFAYRKSYGFNSYISNFNDLNLSVILRFQNVRQK